MIATLPLQNLFSWVVQASVIALLGVLLPRIFRIHHPRSHLIFCHFLLIACLFLPVIQPWQHTLISSNGASSSPASTLSTVASNGPGLEGGIGWNQIVLWILAAGIVARLCRLLAGLWQIHRYRAAAFPLQTVSQSVISARRLTNCNASIFISPREVGPVTFGWTRPVILLPELFLTLGEDEQLAIVCHELLHVRRRDWIVNIVEELVGAVLWFHPAVLWLLSQTKLVREQLVDTQVIEMTTEPEPYIDALLAMAGVRPASATAASFFRRRHFVARMHSILMEHPMSRLKLVSSYALTLVVLAGAGVLAFTVFPLMGQPLIVASSLQEQTPTVPSPVLRRAHSNERIYKASDDGISQPVLLTQVEPRYSDRAREARIQGTVMLDGVVETDGSMTVRRVARGLDPELDHNAVYALQQWRFEPAKRNGIPVRLELAVEVSFNLK